MAEWLPSPPRSRTTTPEAQNISKDLVTELDLLLERYLTLLDEYTTLRHELSKTFSSGFFSLAQAQHTFSLGAGRRYGEDFYDERMKALRTIKTTRQDGGRDNKTMPRNSTNHLKESQTFNPSEYKMVTRNSEEIFTMECQSAKQMLQDGSEITERDGKNQAKSHDPLKWFGILVPPALRQTQSHFIGAVEDLVPKLVSVQLAMTGLESEIWKAREELGIIKGYGEHHGDIERTPEPAANSEISSKWSISGECRPPLDSPQSITNLFKLDT